MPMCLYIDKDLAATGNIDSKSTHSGYTEEICWTPGHVVRATSLIRFSPYGIDMQSSGSQVICVDIGLPEARCHRQRKLRLNMTRWNSLKLRVQNIQAKFVI